LPWNELSFELPANQVDEFEQAMFDCGALSVTLTDAGDQPLFEPAPQDMPLWDGVRLTGLFDIGLDMGNIVRSVCQQLHLLQPPPFRVDVLADREWSRVWMDNFRPMRFGTHLWICPSGYERPHGPRDIVIDLDPGLAFGTGSHPTTALCLQWLDANPPRDSKVVDYGCGSGILAIAAAKLGAQRVIAVDNDPQALDATRANAQRNGISDKIEIHLAGSEPRIKTDLLLANILLEPLIALETTFKTLLERGGQLVLSGILETQSRTLQDAYSGSFRFLTCETSKEWVRLVAVRL
jgi:ribosomal protein L11 methyltransferase